MKNVKSKQDKTPYEAPKMMIIALQTDDVITSSSIRLDNWELPLF